MKIICIGRNYVDHAIELNNEVPTEPVIFIKPKTAILMPGKPLFYPEFTDELQYECELIIRIHKNGKYVPEKHAKKYYDAVSLGIDFTARDLQRKLQKKGHPWELAKSFDGSAAIGDFIEIKDNMDLQNLEFYMEQNGKKVQSGNTKDMVFTINKIVAYVSQYFTLNIGDIIFTGTPAGVGPVAIEDSLKGFLLGKQVFDVSIK
jgi:acylpyruvate hydrolase